MTKTELIDQVAAASGLTKKDSGKAIDAVFDTITQTLSKGEKVQLIGFGSFETRRREARKGRNPQTGAEIEIPAQTLPAFTAGKALKDAVKQA
jgi:DNA-binding protein HU-beta